MPTTNLTRRTALLGSVTLPAALAPLGLAEAATTPTEPDPFVSAFCRYVNAEEAYARSFDIARNIEGEASDEYVRPYCDATDAARLKMCKTVPTTTLGLYLAICALLPVFGEPKAAGDGNLFSFDEMWVHDDWANGSGEALLRSLRTAA